MTRLSLQQVTKIPAILVAGIIEVYRAAVSPFFPPSCRFTPTCSEYAQQALRKYGLFRGLLLSVHRILRCNPWGGHGYDPPVWYSERSKGSEPEPEADEEESNFPESRLE